MEGFTQNMQAPTLHPPTHRLLPYCLKEEVATLPLYWASLCQNSHDGPAFMLSHSVMSDSWQPHGLDSLQAPLSMGFSRQEYWRGLPFPSPGDLPHPEIKPESPADEFLTNVSHQTLVAQIHVSILPQTPLPIRLMHNNEQSSMCCTVLIGHPF